MERIQTITLDWDTQSQIITLTEKLNEVIHRLNELTEETSPVN